MAWWLLTLLLFHSLGLVWADAAILTPNYEASLTLRKNVCWISIKMEEMNPDGWIPWIFSHKLLRTFKRYRKVLELYEGPDDSAHLFGSSISEKLLEKADIGVFKQMTCYAKPSKDAELKKCQNGASKACPSEIYSNVLFIYGIQQQQKNVMHKSLQRLSQKAKGAEHFKTVLFIDCQKPTVMDMRDNPTNCQGGLRLDFDPTLHKILPHSQIEMRSGGNCSDPEIYPGGMLAREKLKMTFLMTWDDGISFVCGRWNLAKNLFKKVFGKFFVSKDVFPDKQVRAIHSTEQGVVVLDSNSDEQREMTQQCVLKNEDANGDFPGRSLWIRHGEGEPFEQKLQPQESVKVKALPHIEIYPFFAVPEALVEKSAEERKSSKKPFYAFHLKLLEQEAKKGDNKSAVQVKTEQLIHKNWLLTTATCRRTKEQAALKNCLDKARDQIDQARKVFVSSGNRKVFVSSGNRKVLKEAITTFMTSVSLANDWESSFEKMRRTFKFIKVGMWLEESEIPDPKPVDRKSGRFGKISRLLRWGTSAQIDVQPLPMMMAGELHLDVALFHAYIPRRTSYAAIGRGSSADVIPCFGVMKIKWSGTHRLYMTERTEKGVNIYNLNNQREIEFNLNVEAKVEHDLDGSFIFVYEKDPNGNPDTKIWRLPGDFSKMTFSQINPESIQDNSLEITCDKWLPGQGNVKLNEPTVDIPLFLDIDVRSTSFFSDKLM